MAGLDRMNVNDDVLRQLCNNKMKLIIQLRDLSARAKLNCMNDSDTTANAANTSPPEAKRPTGLFYILLNKNYYI
jgi:hypothetical protein